MSTLDTITDFVAYLAKMERFIQSGQLAKISCKKVILPMVLQIGETLVLQKGELEEKARSSHFWAFG